MRTEEDRGGRAVEGVAGGTTAAVERSREVVFVDGHPDGLAAAESDGGHAGSMTSPVDRHADNEEACRRVRLAANALARRHDWDFTDDTRDLSELGGASLEAQALLFAL